ncbi:hypothetical protein OIU80_19855 [Flavobacterium sp. LS1R47]|uniref:Uncharacterized protein n=1 Tax=Flavobacterium frigoritolerans TaxID=2987686 RepID=A0A9X3CAH5_9FLAO|nr:hypothetical protein [Flavobacterium frigoritolerans]MCV9934542.1 hypothetical protein [Flavobacterium frigoritolerans]
MAGVYKEVWTGELVKTISTAESGTFLETIPDSSQYAENDVIHLVDIGVEPDVLINNTTYPIPIQALDDDDIPIKLDKFSTKTTPITDDELHALSYDKIASVKERHGSSIAKSKFAKALHSLAPATSTADTPVIKTTGPVVNGRKTLLPKDVVSLKKAYNDMGIASDVILVLCTDHVNDLLANDQKFEKQYYNYTTGVIANMYGFTIYEHISCPVFTSTGGKGSLGSLPTATNFHASVAYHKPYVFKCTGSTKMYYSKAENDTDFQRNKINFTHRFIAMPKKTKAMGAIMSDVA